MIIKSIHSVLTLSFYLFSRTTGAGAICSSSVLGRDQRLVIFKRNELLLGRHQIGIQYPVQVVELVLEQSSVPALCLSFHQVPVGVESAVFYLSIPVYAATLSRYRKASFEISDLGLIQHLHLWIDEDCDGHTNSIDIIASGWQIKDDDSF